jgi:hypothetical protein
MRLCRFISPVSSKLTASTLTPVAASKGLQLQLLLMPTLLASFIDSASTDAGFVIPAQ